MTSPHLIEVPPVSDLAGPIILDLCGGGGTWSQPYADAGYTRIVVDVRSGMDVRWYTPPENVHGILAAPPCTEFAGSGARWWAGKPPGLLWEALGIVVACQESSGRLARSGGRWRILSAVSRSS